MFIKHCRSNKPVQSLTARTNKMFYIKSITTIKFLFILLTLEGIKCCIDGSCSENRRNRIKPGDDPCHPLYWYPQHIPEYCNFKKIPTPPSYPEPEIPVPIPIPVPVIPPPEVPPIMMPPFQMPIPFPIMPLPLPLPFGIPLAPTNPMVPVAGIPLPPPPAFPMPFPPQYPLPPPYGSPYPPPAAVPYLPPIAAPYPPHFPQPHPGPYPAPYPPPYPPPYPMPLPGMGMVPGVPGIVSPDGGINIMPFSDAYSDMLEAHKQKMIRRRMQKLLRKYERPPWKSRRNTRRQSGNEVIDVNHEEKKNEKFNENAFE